MQVIRTPDEAKEVLSSLKDGEEATFDYNPRWRVTRVVGGHIYSSDYAGSCFVPFVQQPIEERKEAKRKMPKVVTK